MGAPTIDRQGGEASEEIAPGHQVGPGSRALQRIPVPTVHSAEDVAETFMGETDPADAESQPVGGDPHELAGEFRAFVHRT